MLFLFGMALSGSAALIYELVWLRSLSYILGNTTYAASTMLSSFMAGLALGSFAGGKIADRSEDHLRLFGLIELLIAIFGLATFYFIMRLEYVYALVFYWSNSNFMVLSIAQFVLSFLLMLVPTTLMGMTFPVALKRVLFSVESFGRKGGNVYAINTAGAVVGVLLAGFILIPFLGLSETNFFAVAINLVVAAVMITWSRIKKVIITSAIILLLLFLIRVNVKTSDERYGFNIYNAKRYRSYSEFLATKLNSTVLFSREGAEGKVQVIRENLNGNRFLVRNGKIEGSLSLDMVNQILLAYLPLSYCKEAKSFLNIGVGTGTTLRRAALKGRKLKRIYCIEIDPNVTKAAELLYPDLLEDRRIKIIYQDARNYLKYSRGRFDIISSEPSYPLNQVEGSLMTMEFFKEARKRLNHNGVFVQWIPYWLLSKEGTQILIKTFGKAFPNMHTWHIKSGAILLVGSLRKEMISPNTICKEVRANLEENYKDGFEFGADEKQLRKRVVSDEIQINNDDHPILEFIASKNILTYLMD